MHSLSWEKIKSTVESHFGFLGSNYRFKEWFGKTEKQIFFGRPLKCLGGIDDF